MVKSKPKFTAKHGIIGIALLVGIVITAQVSAFSDMSRIESTQTQKIDEVSTVKKEAVKTPENKPVENPPSTTPDVTPVTPVVDPNGCEAKGMWYRADNNECIAKPVPVAEVQSVTESANPSPTGSGDCSLVNNYNWPTATAMRVCMQESGGNPNNANWKDNHMSWAGCMGSFGLMQINCSHGQLFDGAANMAVAYSMWSAAGGTFQKDWPNTCAKVGC